MIVDIIFVVVLLVTGLVGYIRGFYKQMYIIASIIIAASLAYLLREFFVGVVFNMINLDGIPVAFVSIIKETIAPLAIAMNLYFIFFIIIKIIISILKKSDVLPTEKKWRLLGSVLNISVTLFIWTFIAFLLSFTTLFNDTEYLKIYDIYSPSKTSEVVLRMNPALYDMSESAKEMYYNVKETIVIFSDLQDGGELTPEQQQLIKDLAKDSKMTEDILVDGSKALFSKTNEEGAKINLNGIPISEMKETVQETKFFPILQELYDEGVITDTVIERIIEENEIEGVNPSDIISWFK